MVQSVGRSLWFSLRQKLKIKLDKGKNVCSAELFNVYKSKKITSLNFFDGIQMWPMSRALRHFG